MNAAGGMAGTVENLVYLKNQLPEVYQARQKQTAIVRGNDIYLFGGQDQTSSYSDVYRGRLNSIDWK